MMLHTVKMGSFFRLIVNVENVGLFYEEQKDGKVGFCGMTYNGQSYDISRDEFNTLYDVMRKMHNAD